MAAVAPISEAVYADITRRYGARRLAELQQMLSELEDCLAGLTAQEEEDATAEE